MEDKDNVQPLDRIMIKHELKNEALVSASTEQLTHKQVQKARNGKRITPNIKGKILRALNAAVENKAFVQKDLFDY